MASDTESTVAKEQASLNEQLWKKKRVKRRPLDRSLDGAMHVYNAIKLTNYYTNLLLKQHQLEIDGLSTIPGANWRTKQLVQQVPYQDIKLLATSKSLAKASVDDNDDSQSNLSQNIEEISFIREQRKLASQFKASLYYLNPVQTKPSNSWLRGSSSNSNQAGGESIASNKQEVTHCCFKCKLPIESDTTCVRVDNLQFDAEQSTETGQESHRNLSGRKKSAISAIFNADNQVNSNPQTNEEAGQERKQAQQAGSSSDEGLGTGSSANSSAKSSTAGSHCDDRETPPHVVVEQRSTPTSNTSSTSNSPSNSSTSTLQPAHCSNSCDNIHKLSLDSLNSSNNLKNTSNSPSFNNKSKKHQRKRSTTLSGDETVDRATNSSDEQQHESGKSSKKSRALTWSASLSSFGASFKFGSSNNDSRERNSSTKIKTDDSVKVNKTILFHTDCFSCSTCNELLVDLRALIYVNELQHKLGVKTSPSETVPHLQSSQLEYVNLPNEHENSEHQVSEEDLTLKRQKISLYCHRHFVELFKPRCQQCDCLILDEECTEAEGKVWHIKHFCCTQCKVPLGGQQYIIVDQSQASSNRIQSQHHDKQHHSSNKNDALGDGKCVAQNSPYCLKCFDMIFGETCEECGKLITCDLGAINHEQRCWHASATCFKCHRCNKSLLGSPFLPSPDGRIYCSIRCSEIVADSTNQTGRAGKLSVANYCDPRAPHGALQYQLTLAADKGTQGESQAMVESLHRQLDQAQEQPVGLLRHKALIDYLLANARTDDTSHQLLNYLYNQCTQHLNNFNGNSAEHNEKATIMNGDERRLMSEMRNILGQIERDRRGSGISRADKRLPDGSVDNQLSVRRNKLNPFLIDSFGATVASDKQAEATALNVDAGGRGSSSVRQTQQPMLMMSNLMDETGEGRIHQQSTGNDQTQANYINLNRILNRPTGVNQKEQQRREQQQQPVDSVDNGSQIQSSNHSTPTSLANLDPIAKNPATKQQDQQRFEFKASQCSPVASLLSNEGTISDQSATSSGVSTAPPVSSTNGSLKSHSPLSSTSSHSSVSSSSSLTRSGSIQTGESRQPVTTLHNGRAQGSPRHINSIAATLERRRRVQPITELSVIDLLSAADDQLQNRQRQQDGFDRLVSHFEEQRNLQQKPPQCAGNKNQESFFFELAQRLPKAAAVPSIRLRDVAVADTGRLSASSSFQVQPIPLDTNGLPTVDSETVGRTIHGPKNVTDHYSKVNKGAKVNTGSNQVSLARGSEQQVANENQSVRKNFFAITSPLLGCKTDAQADNENGASTCATNEAPFLNREYHAEVSTMRPTSSLSVLTPTNSHQQRVDPISFLHTSYSTSSLNQPNNLLSLHNGAQRLKENENDHSSVVQAANSTQKPISKPAKSVSFDPTVKDPPSSVSGSMTLGRSSTLKSALKSSACWNQGNQDQQFLVGFSSATMPTSLSNQLKSSSQAAYSAYYDEQGRRVRLSSLINQRQPSGQNIPIEILMNPELDGQQPPTTGKSLISGALSKLNLSSQSSRGGRREERKMRQQQNSLLIETQPMANLIHQQLFANSVDGQIVQPQQQLVPSTSGLQPLPEMQAERRRRRRSQRSYSRRRSRSSSSRQHHRARRLMSHRASSSRYCADDDCYDSDVCSHCSTCSSTSSCDSDSSLSSEGSYSSRTSYSTYSSDSDDSYTSNSRSSSRSSSPCSSYSGSSRSSSPSPSESSHSNRQSHGTESQNQFSHSSRSGSTKTRRRQRSRGSSSSSSSRQRRHRRGSRGSGRRRSSGQHESRRSSRSSSGRSSSSRASRRKGSSGRYNKRANRRTHAHGSHGNNCGHQQTRRSNRQQHERTQRYAHESSRSVAHLQPAPVAPLRPGLNLPATNLNFYNQALPPPHRPAINGDPNVPNRAKSPSTVSTDSKSAQNNENCRII